MHFGKFETEGKIFIASQLQFWPMIEHGFTTLDSGNFETSSKKPESGNRGRNR
jgi:hypothetical protein